MLGHSLIDKAKNGNQKAYKELFEQNVTMLYRYLRQFTNDRDQVEDWVQRAFIKAFNSLNTFRGSSSFKTWLFRIGINEMRSDLRLLPNKNKKEFDDEFQIEIQDDNENFEWQDEMKWLISDLEEIKKSVFILYEVEGYKHFEIAEMLNISESFSKTSLHRAKKILQEKLVESRR